MKSFLLGFILSVAATLATVYFIAHRYLPTESDIKGCMTTQMYQVHLCPGSESYVPLNQISSYFQKTVLLTEDSGFFQHRGFDWVAIEKNAREGWENGVFKKGGSTITQQLAKNLFLTQDRTFIRKAREAIITYELEKFLTKNEILEKYFNVIEFGKDIYGIKAAADFYFHKSPKDLSITESAFLAMLLPNPKKYSSSFHKKALTEFARQRMHQIIDNMYLYKRISSEEYEVAQNDLARFLAPEPPPEDELNLENGTEKAPQEEAPAESEVLDLFE
jgi:monofunctional biosynthetic peptidoglycan transglycosylase